MRVADPADRGPHRQLGDARRGHHRRLPDLPDRHRPGGDPPRRARDDRGDPRAQARATRRCRPRSASPTSRSASTRPPASCSTRCSCTSASRPGSTRRSCTRRRSCRCRGSPRSSARSRSTWSTTGAREGYDPLQRFLELFEGVDAASGRASRAEELAALPLGERLRRRIIDGERNGLEADLDARSTRARRRWTSSTTTCSRA